MAGPALQTKTHPGTWGDHARGRASVSAVYVQGFPEPGHDGHSLNLITLWLSVT
jgi:hypothetical protein